jgi:hypothetical protein
VLSPAGRRLGADLVALWRFLAETLPGDSDEIDGDAGALQRHPTLPAHGRDRADPVDARTAGLPVGSVVPGEIECDPTAIFWG